MWMCVLGLRFRLRPATPGWGFGVCVCLCTRSTCTPPLLARVCGVGVPAGAWVCRAPPLLAGVLGCVCACPHAPLIPLHSWLGFAVWVCALGLGFRLRPTNPGSGVRVCVRLCVHSAWSPATPGSGARCGFVCLGSVFGCAPQLLAGALGCVCVCVRAPPVPRHSWLRWAVWVCARGLWFWLQARLSWLGCWGVRACLCACSACTPPLLAGVCVVGVRAWAQVWAAPGQSWLGCCSACVFVCARRMYPTTPGWGVPCGCVCWGSRFGCAPPLLAVVLGCACVFVCALCLYPATPGWGVRCGCV